MASAILRMVGKAAKSSAKWTMKNSKKAAKGSSAWAWRNSGAEDVPLISGAADWFGKNVRSKTRDRSNPSDQEQRETARIEQPRGGRVPRLSPVGVQSNGFTREAANDPGAAIQRNREANDRALSASSGFNRAAANDSGIPDKMAEDIHEIRSMMENQERGATGGAGLGGLGAGILGQVAKGLKLGKIGGALGSVGSKIPGVLRAGAGIASGGLLFKGGKAASEMIKMPKGITNSLGALKDMGGTVADAAKTKLSSVAMAGKSLIGKGASGIGKLAGKAGAKSIIKKIPGIGLLAGIGFGAARAAQGDFTGAGMEIASGIAGTVPGIGTAASLGMDAALMTRDASAESSESKGVSETVSKAPAKPAKLMTADYKTPEETVPRGLATLQDFVAMAMDENQGIFVRVKKDVFDVSQRASATPKSPGEVAREKKIASNQERRAAYEPSIMKVKSEQSLTSVAEKQQPFEKIPQTADSLANSPLGNLISRGEGDYDSYNSGTKRVSGGKIGHSGKKNLSEMTLNEIIKSSETKDGNDPDRIFAAGRYQVITPTMKSAMKKMSLTGEEKFTPELQDKMFKDALLPSKVRDFVNGKSDDMNGAQLALAKEWRSFADPSTGKTYADKGAIANKSSISAAESAKALMDTRAKFKLDNPEMRTGGELESVSASNKPSAPQAPIVVPVPTAASGSAPTSSGGGPTGFGGHMGTRNDDSSIKRLTDAKMSFGMS